MREGITFTDRRSEMVGRDPALEYLISRAEAKGMTALAARPKMGKTWVLTEVGRTLSNEHGYLVGYAECVGQTSDLLLCAVSDLYTRWLADASLRQQATNLLARHKEKLITGTGQAVGRLLEGVAKISNLVPEAVGKLVRESFDALAALNANLLSGGLALPKLDYEQARDLVCIIAGVSGKPIALILDAWEQSLSVEFECKTLLSFLSHLADWPRCHVFVGLRRDDPAFAFAQDMVATPGGAAQLYELPIMHLKDVATCRKLLAHLRSHVPATRNVGDEKLLDLIGGFPGVLANWLSDYNRTALKNLADLIEKARDAQMYRYREFNDLLPKLAADERTLALRLALFPQIDVQGWQVYRDVILDGMSEQLLDELNVKKVLEGKRFPTYGHATRHEAARCWFLDRAEYDMAIQRETEALLIRLAGRIRSVDENTEPFAAALVSLGPLATRLELSDGAQVLWVAASSLFGVIHPDSALRFQRWLAAGQRDNRTAPLIAKGLLNTLNHAKAEDDLNRRDRLLDELRQLQQTYRDDLAVRESLAKGLVKKAVEEEGDSGQMETTLRDFWQLVGQYPDDSALQGFAARLSEALRERPV